MQCAWIRSVVERGSALDPVKLGLTPWHDKPVKNYTSSFSIESSLPPIRKTWWCSSHCWISHLRRSSWPLISSKRAYFSNLHLRIAIKLAASVTISHSSRSCSLSRQILMINSRIPANATFSTDQNLPGPLQNNKNQVARKHGAPNAGSHKKQSTLTQSHFTGFAFNASVILLPRIRRKHFSRASKFSNFEPAKSHKKEIKW